MSLSSSDLSAMPWSLMTPSELSVTNIPGKDKVASITPVEPVEGKTPDDAFSLFGNDGFTFADMLDIVNPLQHLPIIAPIYREITGDLMDPGARIAGDTLFGGPIGLATGLLNTAVEAESGTDIGGNIIAMFTGEPEDTPVEPGTPPQQIVAPMVAEAKIAPQSTPAFQPVTAPIEPVTISELLPPPLHVTPIEPVVAKPQSIHQPSSLTALQMQISAQMAQQIAEANSLQLAAPEKPKPAAKADKDQTPATSAPEQISTTGYTAPDNINSAMADALDKYQKIYANPS